METAEGPLGTIIYVSKAHASADEVQWITAASRRNNGLRKITGALLWTGEYFVQVLEGALPSIIAALRLISNDPRHDGIRILEQRRLDARRFGSWEMALVVEPAADSLIAPLIAGDAVATDFMHLRAQLHDMVLRQHGGANRPA